jgi:hypothetical protein
MSVASLLHRKVLYRCYPEEYRSAEFRNFPPDLRRRHELTRSNEKNMVTIRTICLIGIL